MLSHSAFAPLAQSVSGHAQGGVLSHVHREHRPHPHRQANRIPVPIIQKYFNKWLSTAYDLSAPTIPRRPSGPTSGASRALRRGHGREPADKEKLNELSRRHYLNECRGLVDISTTSSRRRAQAQHSGLEVQTAPSATTPACGTASTVICSPRRNMRNNCPRCFPTPRTSASPERDLQGQGLGPSDELGHVNLLTLPAPPRCRGPRFPNAAACFPLPVRRTP